MSQAAPFWGGDEVNGIVIDIGASTVKAGYAGEDMPKAVFPSAAGQLTDKDGKKKLYAGSQNLDFRRDRMEVVYPFDDKGMYSDWDVVDSLWDHTLRDRLRVDPKEHPMMLAEPPFMPKDARERMVSLMFEKYDPPAVFLSKNPVLSSFAMGRPTSLVIDIGHEATVVAAVHEGYVLQKSVVRAPNAGALLNKCMLACVKAKGGAIVPSYTFKRVETPSGQTEIVHLDQTNTTASFRDFHVDQIVADLKESVCRVNEGYFDPQENTNIPMVSYELPDGNEIQVGVDRFAIPEIMFQPKLLSNYPGAGVVTNYDGGELPSITGMILESVNRCDVDIRRELLSGIVLTGGTSLFGQLRDRLERELTEVAPQTTKVKITTPASPLERRFGVWIGGSILASLGTFQQMWMSKSEFEEHGPSLVHRKAP